MKYQTRQIPLSGDPFNKLMFVATSSLALFFFLIGLKDGAFGKEGKDERLLTGTGYCSSSTWVIMFKTLFKNLSIYLST